MAQATRDPSVEEYMDLIRNDDREGLDTFLEESFGSHEDYDDEKAKAFAKAVIPAIEREIKDTMENVTEAPQEVMEAVAVREDVAVEAANDAQVEAANDAKVEEASEDTNTTEVEAGETTEQG